MKQQRSQELHQAHGPQRPLGRGGGRPETVGSLLGWTKADPECGVCGQRSPRRGGPFAASLCRRRGLRPRPAKRCCVVRRAGMTYSPIPNAREERGVGVGAPHSSRRLGCACGAGQEAPRPAHPLRQWQGAGIVAQCVCVCVPKVGHFRSKSPNLVSIPGRSSLIVGRKRSKPVSNSDQHQPNLGQCRSAKLLTRNRPSDRCGAEFNQS